MSTGDRPPRNYYEAPRSRPAAEFDPFGSPVRPGVVTWFKVYATALGVLYLPVALFLGLAALGALVDESGQFNRQERVFYCVLFSVFSIILVVLAAVFLAPLVLPRKPWVWIYDIVLIALGLTSCALWPVCIPLMIFWLKPDCQRYYGRTTPGA